MMKSPVSYAMGRRSLASATAALLSSRYCTIVTSSPPPAFSSVSVTAFINTKSPLLKRALVRSSPLITSRSSLVSQPFSSIPNTPISNDIDDNFDWDETLPFENGSHGSARINVPRDVASNGGDDVFARDTFQRRLEATVTACRELDKASVWVSVPMSRASLIEEMVDVGLTFHHAEGDVANLFMWLKDDMDCKVPTFGTHQVGVGAIVMNSRNDILCVRELRRNYLPWKIPTGLAELGEHLDDAAIREVLEETGVRATFKSVLGVRHTHGMQFNRSDLFFVCRLEAPDVDGEIPEPVAEEGEIAAVAWVPYEEYRKLVVEEHPMMRHLIQFCDDEEGVDDMQRTILKSVVPGRDPSPLYHAPIRKKNEKEDSKI